MKIKSKNKISQIIKKLEYLWLEIKTGKIKKESIVAIFIFILLPITIGSVFLIQRYFSQAYQNGCLPIGVTTYRSSNSADVTFDTGCSIQAEISCSIDKNGNYYPCGQDKEATTNHKITTSENNPLQTNLGYYVKLNTGQFYETLTYIFPYSEFCDRGLTEKDLYDYESTVYGECQGNDAYDPKYDMNQDGCVNMSDLAEIIE